MPMTIPSNPTHLCNIAPLSSTAAKENKKSLKLNRVLPSSTSASNPFPLSPSRSTRTMEEVWKDINLASLNDQNSSRRTNRSTFGGVILQDFLGRPFGIDPPNSMVSSSSVASENSASSLYCHASPAPPLVTALSLNSRPDHHFHLDPLRPKGTTTSSSQLVQQPHHSAPSKVSCFTNPTLFESLDSSPCFGSKRFGEPADCSLGDRRNKRMIKNRESAARSRARKQAYTNELEQKVELLMEENARLKRQIQELWEAADGQQKRKSSLYRTSTAPF